MLNISIKGDNMELTEAIVSALEKKIGTLDKYLAHLGTPQEARVEVGKTTTHHKKGRLFRVEVNLRLPVSTGLIRAEATSFRLYDAVDLVKEELKKEISNILGTKRTATMKGARRAKTLGTETELARE
jgi:putative sigma-54 modulation protein